MAAWFVWAVKSPIILGRNFQKTLGHSTKFLIRLLKKVLNLIIFPNIMGFEHGTWSIFLIGQLKGYVWFWDVKSVSIQAAYYMEWRGPPPYHILSLIRGPPFVAYLPVWALSQFQIWCNSMGNHIQSVAHPLFFLNLTLFSTAHISERIRYMQCRKALILSTLMTKLCVLG